MTPSENGTSKEDATADEAIGRPGPWREGRYQKDGVPVQDSVVRKPKEGPPDTTSTPVTRRDYES